MTTNTDAVPEGWKLVPVEPDLKMVIAGENYIGRHAYAKMLAASPQPVAHAHRVLTGWQSIDTAPEGKLVVVFWRDSTDPENPERHDFDYLEDGVWANHHDNYDHFVCCAPAGSIGPSEEAPYTHWLDIPEVPAAAQPASGGAK